MRNLTGEELKGLISDKVADYSKEIGLFVPLTGDQPVVMYTSLLRGIQSKHYLGSELKLKFSGGLYIYTPQTEAPFDITKHEFSDLNFQGGASIDDDGDIVIRISDYDVPSFYANKNDAIAIALALGVNAEDLK